MDLIQSVLVLIIAGSILATFSLIRLGRGIEVPLWLSLGQLVAFAATIFIWLYMLRFF